MKLESKDIGKYCAFVENREYREEFEALRISRGLGSSGGPICLEKTYQLGLKDIRKLQRYLDRDGIKPEVLDIVINTPSAEMVWIKKERAAKLGLTN